MHGWHLKDQFCVVRERQQLLVHLDIVTCNLILKGIHINGRLSFTTLKLRMNTDGETAREKWDF